MVATVAPTVRGFLLPFGDYFRSLGWTVDAMASGVESCGLCGEHFDRVWEMDWSRNPIAAKNMWSCRRRVRQIVEREKYDIVHVHTPVAAFVARFALRGLRKSGAVKIVYTAHGFHFHRGAAFYRNAIFQVLERAGGRWTDRLVVMNAEDLEAAKRLKIVTENHVTYMPGIGVDTSELNPASVSADEVLRLRREIGLEDSERYLLLVAELIPRKRPRDVLYALAKLRGRDDVHLVVAGNGPLLGELRSLAEQLSIGRRVHFLGFRRDIPTLIGGSTALILPSAQEGLPRSVMEAMCLATPVIGSDIRGTSDLLQNGVGLLVPVGDVEGFSRAMEQTLDSPEAMAAMGKRSRERIGDYDIKKVIAMHESLYEAML